MEEKTNQGTEPESVRFDDLSLKWEAGISAANDADQLKLLKHELSNAMEELRVSLDQLNAQNVELLQSQALVEAERFRYKELFEFAPDAFLITSIEGIIEEANVNAGQLLGVRPDLLVGKPIFVFIDAASRTLVYRKIAACESGKVEKIDDLDVTICPRASEPIATSVTIGLQRDRTGSIKALRWLLRDASEKKHAEEALLHQAQELTKTNLELEQFVTVAAHDLQEPARVIATYSQVLAEKYRHVLDEDTELTIGFLTNAAKKMLSLINDLLVYGSIGKHDRVNIGIDKAVSNAIENLGPTLKEVGANVAVDDLPDILVSSQIVQVFDNLLSNSVKFRSPDTLKISVSAKKSKAGWIVSVTDNGIGFEAQYAEAIFDMFERLNSADEFPGNGIGLAICKKIIESHGGRIWAKPHTGGGAVFSFSLPHRQG